MRLLSLLDMNKYITEVPNAPKAVGPYSPAVVTTTYTFMSGQIPIDPTTGKLCGDGIEEQTEQVMKNIQAVLNHLGKNLTDIVKTTIFLMDLSNFQVVNEIYGRWMNGHKPARSTVQVAGLPFGAKVEIECIVG